MATVVDVRDAVKNFGPVRALDGVSLQVRAGEVVALLGPNGAGKTTCVSLMIGLRKPTSGTATLFGLAPADLRARTRCGVMLQESGLPSYLTVRETIDLFRTYYPAPLSTQSVVELVGLEEKERAQLHTLSGGQRQRLYFGLAMCGDPELLFLDEPTVGLDVEARRGFWTHVKSFVRSGRTVVLTTHYLEEADALADRIVVIDRGRILADASPAVLKSATMAKRVSYTAARAAVESDFEGLPLQTVVLDGSRVEIVTSEPEALLRALFLRGDVAADLEVTGASLEHAVLQLTARDGA
ncbi:MAG TPA: ABC transporter ATP-binding protein [Candidatus Eremiobacteraceae bacterium]|nr:ABC transporter ATP-binding protein [Candidatus Eremiobacteraceae bacterium]